MNHLNASSRKYELANKTLYSSVRNLSVLNSKNNSTWEKSARSFPRLTSKGSDGLTFSGLTMTGATNWGTGGADDI